MALWPDFTLPQYSFTSPLHSLMIETFFESWSEHAAERLLMCDIMHSRIFACPVMPAHRDLTSAVQSWCGRPTVVPAAFAAEPASNKAATREAQKRAFIVFPFALARL